MVGHGEVHHACGALLLGQVQTGAAPVLEHAGLGVLVCGSLEFCTHGHSCQVGNIAAILQGDLCTGDIEFIGLGSVLGVLCLQRDVICGHREGDGRLSGVHVSGQTGHFPTGEGVTVLLGCGSNELCAHRHSRQVGNSAAVLQGDRCIGDIEFIGLGSVLGVLCFQCDLVCGHREGDGRLSGVHVSGQTGHFPTGEGVTVLLGCGGNELCTHGHSCQVGNSAAVLQGDLCIGDIEFVGLGSICDILRVQRDLVCGHLEGNGRLGGVHVSGQTGHFPAGEGLAFHRLCNNRNVLIKDTRFVLPIHGQGVGVLLVLRGQRDVVCGHREGDSCLAGVRTLGHAIYLPTGEGVTSLLGCGKRDFLTKCTAFFLPVHGQGVVDRLIAVRHPHVIAGHGELEFDMRAGIGDGIRILCQTFDLPDNVIAFLLVNAKGDLIALIMRLAFLSIPVVVILRLGRLGHNIGVHFVLVANVVVTIIHHDVNAVSACLGGLRHRRERAILRVILDRIQRGIVKIHLAVIGCSLGLGVIRKVGAARGIFAYHLADIKRAFCVLVALLRYDALLVDAVLVIRRVGCKHLVVGGAHIDEAQFAHAILFAGNARNERAPVDVKVALAQGREGQLSGGGHVHHNRLAVILGGDIQRAVNGRGALVVIAGFRTVDVRDCIAEADLCLDITDKVNRVCCCGIVVEAFHSAVRHHQLALLLTGGKVFAFNIATAYRIGNSGLAVAVRFQAAKDHGILDNRFLRGIARQLDIVEHTAGDLAVLVQLDHSVECAAGDRTISADDILESAACDGAVVIRVDILLEGTAFNGGILHINRAIRLNAGDGHICKSDLLHGNGLMVGVDGTRSKIHRVAVRGGDVKRRACPSVLFHGGVLPAQTLIEVSRHAPAAHRHTGHAGQVGQTLFGNAQRLEVAWIGGLIHKDLCAVIVAGNAQHLAVGRGVGVVAADRCIVDAQHIGVQGKFCAACAHQIDGIGGKRQSSAVHRSHTAVAHHQRAELLSCGQQLLDAVRQLAQNRIRNGVGVIAIGIEIAALDHRIGDRARAIAEQGIEGAAGDLDRTVPVDRADARADIVEGAAADLTAGDLQSAVFAKLTAGNISIGDLDIAVDRHIAQLTEIEVRAALIQDLQSAFIAAVFGVAVITPAVAHVNTVQLCVRVQTVHIGHVGQIGLTLIVKAQFCGAKCHRNQLHGCAVLRRDHVKAGGKRFSVIADGDRGNRRAKVCEGVILGTGGQCHDTAAGRGYRPYIAAGVAFHCQFQIVPVTGIVILLDDIDFCFLLSVQGAVFRQQQLVCLLLRISAQAGDIAEKAAPDIAAVLSHLIVGAAVNGAQIQLHIGVAAAQNADAVHIVGLY